MLSSFILVWLFQLVLKVAWNRGPTLDIIWTFYPRVILSPNYCPLCISTVESNAHLFIHCPFSWRLWDKLLELANFNIVIPATLIDLFNYQSFLEEVRKLGSYVYMASFGLLKERSRLVFKNLIGDFSSVWDSFLFLFASS